MYLLSGVEIGLEPSSRVVEVEQLVDVLMVCSSYSLLFICMGQHYSSFHSFPQYHTDLKGIFKVFYYIKNSTYFLSFQTCLSATAKPHTVII